jgi:hypothetical protein
LGTSSSNDSELSTYYFWCAILAGISVFFLPLSVKKHLNIYCSIENQTFWSSLELAMMPWEPLNFSLSLIANTF